MDDVRVIRSSRRTVGLEIGREGEVVVRAPMRFPMWRIRLLLVENEDALRRARERWLERQAKQPPEPTEADRKALQARARAELPALAARFGRQMGLEPGRVRITSARTRWGSCSAKGNICFSWRLMRMPREFIEYVVVHELAHLREMNHGPRFWEIVGETMPDYRERRALGRVQQQDG